MHRLLATTGLIHGAAALPLDRVLLHPTAIAAWVGMLATSLNLLPGGQLDGGHIIFSIAPRAHKIISRLTILILLFMAYYLWTGWFVWAILLQLSSLRHPQVAEWPKVSGGRMWLALFALLMLLAHADAGAAGALISAGSRPAIPGTLGSFDYLNPRIITLRSFASQVSPKSSLAARRDFCRILLYSIVLISRQR